MNKIVKVILVSIMLLLYTINGVLAAPPQCSAKSAILMDGNSGRILWGKNYEEKRPMASTTKIMTALVALENGKLDEIITVAPSASGIEGSSIWLSPGEKHTLEDLLYGLMLRSGNDAAVAIAQHIGGSVEGFVDMMNEKAKKIGAINSHFENPHGLHHDNHYSTAYDLALIASYALKNSEFEKIVSTKYKTIPWEGHDWDRVMQNKNKLLWQYEGANGVKTGYTKKAGRCLVASAKRNGLQLVAVVLDCGPMFEECMALLDYGFKEFKNDTILQKGELLALIPVDNGKVKELPLVAAEGFSMALKDGEKVKFKIDKPMSLKAPIKEGEPFGSVSIYFEDKLYKEIPLIAGQSIEEMSIWDRIVQFLREWIR